MTDNKGGEKLLHDIRTNVSSQIVRKAVRCFFVQSDESVLWLSTGSPGTGIREWHMRAIKSESMYVAAGLGVRKTSHQFRSIGLLHESTQCLDEQAQRQAKMFGASGKCPSLMPLRKHSYSELGS